MSNQELMKKREERVRKTIRREKTDKVPYMMIADAYVPYYAKMNPAEITNYDQAVLANKIMYDDLQNDCALNGYMPPQLMMGPKLGILEGGAHVIGKNMIKQINPKSTHILEPEEYPELINNPLNYLLETVFPRRFELLKKDDPEEKYGKFIAVLQEGMKFGEYLGKIETETSTVCLTNMMLYLNPIDLIFGLLRNFDGIVRDIRRCPDLLRDAGLAMVDTYVKMAGLVTPVDHKALFCPMNLPAFMRPKDFEKVYWPSYKKLTEQLVEQGHNIIFYYEKNYSHLYDYLQELPKMGIIGIFEEDDLKVVKERLGSSMAIAGGLETSKMRYGTKEECINMTKTLIDNLGRDGGYFIAPSTPLLFSSDATPENLKAISETISTHGLN